MSVGFSRDGQWVVTGSKEGVLKVWNVASGSCVKTIAGHEGEILHCLFIKQDGFFLSAGSDGAVKLWDIKSGRCVHGFYGHHGKVLSLDKCDDFPKRESMCLRLARQGKMDRTHVFDSISHIFTC